MKYPCRSRLIARQDPSLTGTAVLVACLALTFSLPAHADPLVGGGSVVTEDTTFTLAGSPYVIVDTLVVANGGEMTIDAGVQVKMASHAVLIVLGDFHCVGLPGSRIIFGPEHPEDTWGVLGLLSIDSTAEIQYTHFTGGSLATYEEINMRGTITAFSSDLLITDCVFEGTGKHAISTSGCSGLVARNQFTDIGEEPIDANWSSFDVIDNSISGALADGIDYNYSSGWPEIRGNHVVGTHDDGIDLDEFEGLVSSNVVSDCFAEGISASLHTNATLENNVVSDCLYGIAATAGSVIEVRNNTLADCFMGLYAAEKYSGHGASTVTGSNMLIWNHTVGVQSDAASSVELVYSNVQGVEVFPGEGNIMQDPLYVNPVRDFHLLPGSPCIDSGLGDATIADYDFEGDHRVDDPDSPNVGGGSMRYVDIGADEFQPGTTAVTLDELAPRPVAFRVHPNPVGRGASVHLNLVGEGLGTGDATMAGAGEQGGLYLYDVTGRLRRQWGSIQLPMQMVWNGRDDRGRALANGTYFLEFRPVDTGHDLQALRTRIVIAH